MFGQNSKENLKQFGNKGGNKYIKFDEGPVTGTLFGEERVGTAVWSAGENKTVYAEKAAGGKFKFAVQFYSEGKMKLLQGTQKLYQALSGAFAQTKPEDVVISITRTGAGFSTDYKIEQVSLVSPELKAEMEASDKLDMDEEAEWSVAPADDGVPF